MSWYVVDERTERTLGTYNSRLTACAVAEMYKENGVNAYVTTGKEVMI